MAFLMLGQARPDRLILAISSRVNHCPRITFMHFRSFRSEVPDRLLAAETAEVKIEDDTYIRDFS